MLPVSSSRRRCSLSKILFTVRVAISRLSIFYGSEMPALPGTAVHLQGCQNASGDNLMSWSSPGALHIGPMYIAYVYGSEMLVPAVIVSSLSLLPRLLTHCVLPGSCPRGGHACLPSRSLVVFFVATGISPLVTQSMRASPPLTPSKLGSFTPLPIALAHGSGRQ